jgi:hypothetical protein
MTTLDSIIQIFCAVDDEMKDMSKHSQAKLYPSELVTIGILFALKRADLRGVPLDRFPPRIAIQMWPFKSTHSPGKVRTTQHAV